MTNSTTATPEQVRQLGLLASQCMDCDEIVAQFEANPTETNAAALIEAMVAAGAQRPAPVRRSASRPNRRRKACITGGNCSSFGDGHSCGGHDCDGH